MASAAQSSFNLILAPLRGVTIRCFRSVFASALAEARFSEVVTPFVPANPGVRVTENLFAETPALREGSLAITPQIISRHPEALAVLLKGFRTRGFTQVDLNAGCPFPMIVRRGRGSGLLRTPDILEKLLETGCSILGPNHFSLKIRLGISSSNELLALMPRINRYPLRMLTIHARTAHQMYEGVPDWETFSEVAAASVNPVVYNGDVPYPLTESFRQNPVFKSVVGFMIGRSFVRALGARSDAQDLLRAYVAHAQAELSGDSPVLGRVKELVAYWLDVPYWKRLWTPLKMCRSVEELRMLKCA